MVPEAGSSQWFTLRTRSSFGFLLLAGRSSEPAAAVARTAEELFVALVPLTKPPP